MTMLTLEVEVAAAHFESGVYVPAYICARGAILDPCCSFCSSGTGTSVVAGTGRTHHIEPS